MRSVLVDGCVALVLVVAEEEEDLSVVEEDCLSLCFSISFFDGGIVDGRLKDMVLLYIYGFVVLLRVDGHKLDI